MSWCPKCKNEYVEGITFCPDCNVDLVDELPDESNEILPSILCHVTDEQIGGKFILYLQYKGLQTAGLMPVPADDEEYEDGFYVVVASSEKEMAQNAFEGFDSVEELAQTDISELIPQLEDQLEELQSEEASKMLSDLRTEQSSVYVKKKDKYTDLKFSGVSFIVFGILGAGLLTLNGLGYISIFTNLFSSFIMTIVFIVFLIVGITSLLRAKKMKTMVSQEEKMSDDVLIWLEENVTDDWLDERYEDSQTEEANYFTIHSQICQKAIEQFPYLNKDYIDQLMDERYNEYCESRELH